MSDNPELDKLRERIDALDVQLVRLLDQRAQAALEVAQAKKGAPAYRPEREAQVLRNVVQASEGPLDKAALQTIYRQIIAACRNLQQPFVVSYLGPEGTYTEEAARRQFGERGVYVPYTTLEEVLRAAEKNAANVAVVPVENSTEGAVSRTLDLLLYTKLGIVGEISLPIHHQLLTRAKKTVGIAEVLGHPQALAQCREWLNKHLPAVKRTPTSSNAEAARLVCGLARKGRAAIAGKRAAEIYNLPILYEDIEDSSANTTRFLVLGKQMVQPTGDDKTSLVCSVPNEPGTLHRILSIFANAEINLTKLESRPAPSGVWDYVFFIDIEGHETDERVLHAFDELHAQAVFVKILGSYPKGA